MTTWTWVGVGLAAFFAAAGLGALVAAAILGRISEEISGLIESELWTLAPSLRERREAETKTPAERRLGVVSGERARGRHNSSRDA
jgi:hypothetical protein